MNGSRDEHLPLQYLASGEQLVDFRHGRLGCLLVVRKGHLLRLKINHGWQGEDRKTHQILAAHFPMILAHHPSRVAVVGLGTGQTCRRFLMYDEVDHLTCIDLEDQLFELVETHFDGGWMKDARVELRAAEGRRFFQESDDCFDLISVEVGQMNLPGAVRFYTQEFYQLARDRLREGGCLSQCLPISFLTLDQFRAAVETFRRVFPQCLLLYNTAELLLIGARSETLRLEAARLRMVEEQETLNRDLRFAYWGGPRHWMNQAASFLASLLAGPCGLAQMGRGGEVARDAASRLTTITGHDCREDEARIVRLICSHLDPLEGLLDGSISPDVVARADALRAQNLKNIAVSERLRRLEGLLAQQGRAAAIAWLQDAEVINPEHGEVKRLIGDLLDEEGQLEAAIAYYDQALAIDPENVEANFGRGLCDHKQGHVEAAIARYRVAVRTRPAHARAYNNLGTALAQQGDFAAALTEYERAVASAPDWQEPRLNLAKAHNALGVTQLAAGHKQPAADHFRKALELEPALRAARQNLARAES